MDAERKAALQARLDNLASPPPQDFGEGQLRWVQMYSSIGDTPPYHLSFDGRMTVCGIPLYEGGEITRYETDLTGSPPEPRCPGCQTTIRAHLGLDGTD